MPPDPRVRTAVLLLPILLLLLQEGDEARRRAAATAAEEARERGGIPSFSDAIGAGGWGSAIYGCERAQRGVKSAGRLAKDLVVCPLDCLLVCLLACCEPCCGSIIFGPMEDGAMLSLSLALSAREDIHSRCCCSFFLLDASSFPHTCVCFACSCAFVDSYYLLAKLLGRVYYLQNNGRMLGNCGWGWC
jgi:hypothetical protein